MVTKSRTVITVNLTSLPSLIRLYREDAHIDTPELINLTCRALEAGLDSEYAYRTHAMHTDVPQATVKEYLKDLYNDLCNVLLYHGFYVLNSLDVVTITHNSVVLLIDS